MIYPWSFTTLRILGSKRSGTMSISGQWKWKSSSVRFLQKPLWRKKDSSLRSLKETEQALCAWEVRRKNAERIRLSLSRWLLTETEFPSTSEFIRATARKRRRWSARSMNSLKLTRLQTPLLLQTTDWTRMQTWADWSKKIRASCWRTVYPKPSKVLLMSGLKTQVGSGIRKKNER